MKTDTKTKAKMTMPEDTPKGKGEGHKARIIVDLKANVEMDGKKTQFNINYDLAVTFEQVDYAIRKIAGGIAQAASTIARDGLKGDGKRAEESVTA